jgi:DNA-binding response OmpR family regulator
VVMLTALAQAADRDEGADAGADGYLTKPFKPGDLVDAVKDYIGN